MAEPGVTKENIAGQIRQKVEEARYNVREEELEAQEAEEAQQELVRELMKAQITEQREKEAKEKGQETERQIEEVTGG